MQRHVWFATLALFLGGTMASNAGEAKTGFINKVFKDGTYEAKYIVFVPHSYDGKTAVPAILFLHGRGESGSDGVRQSKTGIGPAVLKREKDFPFLVIFPQSHKISWKADSEDGKRAMAILDEVCKQYRVDSQRTYLSGLSMGGFGTWSLAVAHPDRWAAIVPICGGGDTKNAEKIKHIPCWCFQGDADPAVPVQKARDMMAALKKAGGAPRYTEYPGIGHNSWDQAYGTDELYTWLLEQRLK